MMTLPMDDDVVRIELVHSAWINYERTGDLDHLLALCADDIEFWPPNDPPIDGREAVARYLRRSKTAIHDVEVCDRRIRVSDGLAYLTAKYRTTYSAPNGPRTTIVGSHLWILRSHANNWMVALVAWSIWA
jgi:ketosteroid isomerase-like protein